VAMRPPMPWQPSIAQVRSVHRRAEPAAARHCVAAGRDLDRGLRLCGSVPITTFLIWSSGSPAPSVRS
jgi:hypothetical protein